MNEPQTGRILSDRQRLAWLRLIRSEYVGPATFRTLLNHYGSAEAALAALPELSRRGGARRAIRICPRDEAMAEIDRLAGIGGRLVALGEPDYPPLLRHIDGPPPLLSAKGGNELFAGTPPCVAIVGARNCSLAGARLAARLSRDLGHAGFLVVSGLARGIDAAAHEAALETGTIAVFAGGLESVYPPDNEDLANRILDRGAWYSEMPPGWQPRARDFPRRNRLIAGMSHGVVLIEAARRSGSLHTARFALEQGRDVLAVPGSPLDPRCEGCNALIRDGAVLVRDADDVLAALDAARALPPPPPLIEEDGDDRAAPDVPGDARQAIVRALGPTPVDIDDLIRHTGLPVSLVHIVLLELELAGRLERHAPHRVSLTG